MRYDTNCTCCSIEQWNALMKGARKASYRRLVERIRKELPEVYERLALWAPNPYAESCRQTKTHYILVHSAIEHFILRN